MLQRRPPTAGGGELPQGHMEAGLQLKRTPQPRPCMETAEQPRLPEGVALTTWKAQMTKARGGSLGCLVLLGNDKVGHALFTVVTELGPLGSGFQL